MKNFITNILINIESKLDSALDEINKAIKTQEEAINWSKNFYNLSLKDIKEAERLVDEINKIENKCQDSELDVWHYKYKEIQEDISYIKLLQDFYINL